jgi:diguanylate cyclase (GGDEF)-like protein
MPASSSTRPRRSQALPADVYASLVDSLFGSFVSLVGGAIGGSIAAAMTAARAGEPALYLVSAAIAVVGLCRVVTLLAYGRRLETTAQETRRWEVRYAVGAYAYAALFGLWCFVAIAISDDAVVHLICAAVTVGYTAGISGRNAGRPWIVNGQIVLGAGPLAAGLLLHSDPLYAGLAFLLILFFTSMKGVSQALHETLVKALVKTREVAALADRFDTALNNMSHGLCMLDPQGRIMVFNAPLVGLFRLDTAVDRRGMPMVEFLAECVETGVIAEGDLKRIAADVTRCLAGPDRGSYRIVSPDERTFALTFQAMGTGGSVVLVEDITERTRAETRLAHMARYDVLTGLLNRNSFREHLDLALAQARRRDECFAVLCIDLDEFKQVNDTQGHPFGDLLLCAVGERLRATVRDTDVVARFGGDEFVVLQSGIEGVEDAGALARRIVEELGNPYDVEGHQVLIGGSVGIAIAPHDGAAADDLLKNADMALYRAKAEGRGTWRFFEQDMDTRARARRSLEQDLRRALALDQFELHYQPIVDLASGRIASCEGLVRWRHPERGMISPGEFIPAAEEMGLIVELGDWVLNQACREAASWPGGVRVAVNLSSVQFRRTGLVEAVKRALAGSGLSPQRLELEITESVLLQDIEATRATLLELRALGIRISLDDFGTGYSSLAYLHSFPFQKVKIDRSFLRGLGVSPRTLVMLRGVTRLCADLGMAVVVEGIETEEQLALVSAEVGPDEAQGFLFSRPVPSPQLRKLLGDFRRPGRQAA